MFYPTEHENIKLINLVLHSPLFRFETKNPEYPGIYPEYPDLYPEFRPECSKPGVSGLIPGVSGPDSIFAPKTEILILAKPTHQI